MKWIWSKIRRRCAWFTINVSTLALFAISVYLLDKELAIRVSRLGILSIFFFWWGVILLIAKKKFGFQIVDNTNRTWSNRILTFVLENTMVLVIYAIGLSLQPSMWSNEPVGTLLPVPTWYFIYSCYYLVLMPFIRKMLQEARIWQVRTPLPKAEQNFIPRGSLA